MSKCLKNPCKMSFLIFFLEKKGTPTRPSLEVEVSLPKFSLLRTQKMFGKFLQKMFLSFLEVKNVVKEENVNTKINSNLF